jgi:phenylacetic acid degradation operon negative regulatory protein
MADAASTPDVVPMPRHQHLIVTIYGLYSRDHGGVLAISDLISLLGELGVESAGVRSSVSRLKKRGVLVSTRHGGSAAYKLAPELEEVFAAGDERIFSPRRAQETDDWILTSFSVPESQRHLRHQLRAILTRMGCGQVSAGLWIAPGHLAAEISLQLHRAGLMGYADLFKGAYLSEAEISEKVGQWWDLAALEALYKDFLDAHEDVLRRWPTDPGNQAPESGNVLSHAFADYVTTLTQWRRLPYMDPGLPVVYLPEDWAGLAAEKLFAEVHARLAPMARRYAKSVLG